MSIQIFWDVWRCCWMSIYTGKRQVTRTLWHVTVLHHNSWWKRRLNPKPHSTSAVHITFYILIQRMRWAEHVAPVRERRDVYRILLCGPEGKRPLGRTRRRWEYNIYPFTLNDHYSGRTAPLTSKHCTLYIYSTNIVTEYFKHGIYSPFFSL